MDDGYESAMHRGCYTQGCPCGFAGDPARECRCGTSAIARYQKRISGPLLDRIDIHLEVPRIDYEQLSNRRVGEASAAVRARVEAARAQQAERFAGTSLTTNADMGPRELQEHAALDGAGEGLMRSAVKQLHLSGAADALREVIGLAVLRIGASRYDYAAAAAREALGEASFDAAWGAGRALPIEQAIDEVATLAQAMARSLSVGLPLCSLSASDAPSPALGNPLLTNREVEVLRLIAEGRSNREIAETLFVSPRTVTTHTTGPFTKLEVGSRTAAVAAAPRLELL